MAEYRLGVDVGGTFTDFVLVNDVTGTVTLYKQLTTPHDPTLAVMEGIQYLLSELKIDGSKLDIVIHGTTLVANAIIERKGARVILLTTSGTRDVLAVGNENRYDINDRLLTRPAPLVPRDQIYEVTERLQWNGLVRVPLDLEPINRWLSELNTDGQAAIAVCLLHSYRYPEHERAIKAFIQQKCPTLPISISSEVAPQIREFPRMSTTVANAYVQPLMNRYLGGLAHQLRGLGYARNLYLMLSDGGISTSTTASTFPVRLVESGAAGGALASVNYGRLVDCKRLISFDMGGTTAKICVVEDQTPKRTTSVEVARINRFKKGSGLPLLLPVIELMEIGAGGGSIARVDNLGLIQVGPESAGAQPGPACYGLGGTTPTVTDAALLLGYLNPNYFLGGRMALDRNAALSAVSSKIAQPLGIDVIAAANGIYEIATQNMADAVRVYLAELGKDARDYTFVAFGGGGPLHACRIARSLKIPRVLIPLGAGATSALGFLTAPIAFEHTRTYISELNTVNWDELEDTFNQMLLTSLEILKDAGVAPEAASHSRWADMRYRVQTHEIEVELPPEPLSRQSPMEIQARFEQRYFELFGYNLPNREIEIIGCRLRAQAPSPRPLSPTPTYKSHSTPKLKAKRAAYFRTADGFATVPVYDRYALEPGDVIEGPAVIEEPDSTTLLDPAARAMVDKFMNLHIDLQY